MSESEVQLQQRIEELQSVVREGFGQYVDDNDEAKREFKDLVYQEMMDINKEYARFNEHVYVSGFVQLGHRSDDDYDRVDRKLLTSEPMIDRGLVINWDEGSGGRDVSIHHMFLMPEATRFGDVRNLTKHITQYFAIAPFGSVWIDAGRTNDQRIDYLNHHAPDLIGEFDDLVLNADDSVNAVMNLSRQRISNEDNDSTVINDMIGYARESVEIDKLPLLSVDLYGVHFIKLDDGPPQPAVFNRNEEGGGGMSAIGRIKELHLGQHGVYDNNSIRFSDELYWGASIEILAVNEANSKYLGKVIGISLVDVDGEEVKPDSRL